MYEFLRSYFTKVEKILPRQLRKEEFFYYSDLPLEVLRSDIQELFFNPGRWQFSVNLAGEFISDYEFKMTPKWQFAVVTGSERMISYLNGRLYQDKFQRTRINFEIRPNSVFPLLFFVFPLVGLLSLIDDGVLHKNGDTLLGALTFIVFMPVLTFILAYRAKQLIKKEFIRTFNLKPVA